MDRLRRTGEERSGVSDAHELQRAGDALRAELAAAALAVAARGAAPAAPPRGDPLDEFFWAPDERAPGLAAVAGAPVARAPAEPDEARREWVAFLLGAEEYALEIGSVREILKAPAITEVPRAPAHVLGVIMVRGEVIAVFDPRRRLGIPGAPSPRGARVLVCDAGQGPRGLLVDAVSGVVRLPASAVEARPGGVGGAAADYITGIGRDGTRFVVLLDAPALLRDAPGAPAAAAGGARRAEEQP
jgi:purine-binding chemotaxis protein CheW